MRSPFLERVFRTSAAEGRRRDVGTRTMQKMTKVLLCLALLGPALAQAQATAAPPPPPPPLVNAPDVPLATPADQAPTPPPPGSIPPPGVGSPLQPNGSTGYQPYFGMGYGPKAPKPEGPEVGLMITEGAFGILTAAASTLLPYLLLSQLGQVDSNLETIILLVILAAEPLSVSQTEMGIANGSHYYMSDTWPGMLSGLAAEGAVIGLFYLLRPNFTGDGATTFLLATSVALVPLVEMAVINLTKYPRSRMWGAVHYSREEGWAMSVPIPAPYAAVTAQGTSVGLSLPILAGRF